jgi:hypothetical protein
MEDTMTDATTIRRRPDGSIDTSYYTAKGRLHRSTAARDTARRVTRKSRTALVVLATLGLATLFLGGQI